MLAEDAPMVLRKAAVPCKGNWFKYDCVFYQLTKQCPFSCWCMERGLFFCWCCLKCPFLWKLRQTKIYFFEFFSEKLVIFCLQTSICEDLLPRDRLGRSPYSQIGWFGKINLKKHLPVFAFSSPLQIEEARHFSAEGVKDVNILWTFCRKPRKNAFEWGNR